MFGEGPTRALGAPHLSPPLPSNSSQFSFACKCLNLQVDGRMPLDVGHAIATKSPAAGGELCRLYLAQGTEHVKHPAYATFDQQALEQQSDASDESSPDRGELPPSWRTCWICGVKCYQVAGKMRDDPPAEDAWVTVELGSGIKYGDELDAALGGPALPFSSLLIELPTSSSNFGRPPRASLSSSVYPSSPSSSTPHAKQTFLIPPVPDPFFLPPPFIPSNPHLRDLCNLAVTRLKERHAQLEDEIKNFIAQKAQEMRGLEEQVRCEVELLWERYRDGPGKGDEVERSRSASLPRSSEVRARSRERTEPFSPSPVSPRKGDNPIMREASRVQSFPAGSSLLSMSFTANFAHPPPPAPIPPTFDDRIDELARSVNKTSDQRAVAMSHMFSVLEEAMAGDAREGARKQRKISATPNSGRRTGEPQGQDGDLHGKDSWIDGERALANRVLHKEGELSELIEEEMEGRTPRPRTVKELHDEGKGKGRTKVTFEEPTAEAKKEARANDKGGEDEGGLRAPEDVDGAEYVFDFELEDDSPEPDSTEEPDEYPEGTVQVDISRTRNIVEANLSTTFAADAPSHRAAWRRIKQNSSIYAAMQRRSSDASDSENESEEGAISKLAVSMPLNIALPPARTTSVSGLLPLERKTSLSEREGVLVPPLKAAMRQRGILRNNSLGLDVPSTPGPSSPRGTREGPFGRRGSRSASVSRERELVMSFKADPGAVFEALVDDDDDDDGEDGEEQQEGTLRDSRAFVPPHVLARKESMQAADVGWRSMVTE